MLLLETTCLTRNANRWTFLPCREWEWSESEGAPFSTFSVSVKKETTFKQVKVLAQLNFPSLHRYFVMQLRIALSIE